MPRGQSFGRRVRITVGNLIVTDIDPAAPLLSERRSLDCTFSTEAHTKLEPLATEVTIFGLNKVTRDALLQQQKTAASQAWQEYQKVLTGAVLVEPEQAVQVQQQLSFQGLQVRIEAGYVGDWGLIANATTMPDGVKHKWTGGGWVTTIKAQDGRYPWQNGFVNEPVAPGVTLRDMDLITQLSEGFLDGTLAADVIQQKVPELLVRKDFAGYINGGILSGQSRNIRDEIAKALGLTAFFDRGQLVYLDLNAVTQAQAVELVEKGPAGAVPQPTPGGLLEWEEQSRGYVTARCLLNHNLTAGRQVVMRDRFGEPIGAGVFRVDHVRHVGSAIEATYNSEALLRPTNINQATNV